MSEIDLGAMRDRLLVLGTHGHVAALDRETGTEIWRTNLERTGWQLVTLLVQDDVVYAASGGRVFALALDTGRVIWRNDLKGLGLSTVTMATLRHSPSEHAQPVGAHAQAQAARHAGGGAAGT